MLSPFIPRRLSARTGEDAVAFSKAGSVNAGEQTIKMPRNVFGGARGFNPLLSKNASLPSFPGEPGLKRAREEA
jgi:hypothetical protein